MQRHNVVRDSLTDAHRFVSPALLYGGSHSRMGLCATAHPRGRSQPLEDRANHNDALATASSLCCGGRPDVPPAPVGIGATQHALREGGFSDRLLSLKVLTATLQRVRVYTVTPCMPYDTSHSQWRAVVIHLVRTADG